MSDTLQSIDLTGLSVETDVAPGVCGISREKYVKPRRSRKAPGIKAAVITRRVNNESKRKIAKDLGITRNTVATILEESHIEQHLQAYQHQSMELIPEALRVMRVRLQGNSENAAIKTLESTIWPLTDKRNKGNGDQGVVLAIQNLMGNVQVGAQATDIKAVEPVKAIDIEAKACES